MAARRAAKKKAARRKKPKRQPGQLTAKQQRFVEEYVVDFNGAGAAVRAGYAKRSARQQANELLTKPDIQKAVGERSKKLAEAAGSDAMRVIAELERIAFSRMGDLAEWGDRGRIRVKSSDEMSDDAMAALREIAEVDVDEVAVRRGIKLHDKARALQLLGQYHRLFVQRVAVSDDQGGVLRVPAGQTEEEWENDGE